MPWKGPFSRPDASIKALKNRCRIDLKYTSTRRLNRNHPEPFRCEMEAFSSTGALTIEQKAIHNATTEFKCFEINK